MRAVSPRVIRGNRGDLISRYGILSALYEYGLEDITVCVLSPADIAPLPFDTATYGTLYNLIPSLSGWRALIRAKYVLWLAGLDLQDDSSLVKLVHTLITFLFFRLLGKKVLVLCQGAGPLNTNWGRALTGLILSLVEDFIARDTGSYNLLKSIKEDANLRQGYDGIFLGPIDPEASLNSAEVEAIDIILQQSHPEQPLIGFNIRQWFHFSASLLPYQFNKRSYLQRSQAQMDRFLNAAIQSIHTLRKDLSARIILLSAYEPGVEPWEDDLPWLSRIKDSFPMDDQVVLVDCPLSLMGHCALVSRLDLMIGVRLHSALTALRFGVPAINISYTLKGRDIFNDLGFSDWIIDLEDYILDSMCICHLAGQILDNLPDQQKRVSERVGAIMDQNTNVLDKSIADLIG